MGRDCTWVLRARIEPAAGKVLASLCRDWQFIEYLEEEAQQALKSPFKEIYEHCEPLFESCVDKDSIMTIERGMLDLVYEGKFPDAAVETFETSLPKFLVELRGFHYEIPEFGSRVDFQFDPKNKKLVRRETKTEHASEETDLGFDTDWEEEYGTLEPEEWRGHLASFLELVSDLPFQHRVFVEKSEQHDFDPPFTDFEIWFDLNAYYIGRLNLEAGLEWAESEGFIDAKQRKLLAPFDQLFRNYLPENMATKDARPILAHPEWKAICAKAKDLAKAFR